METKKPLLIVVHGVGEQLRLSTNQAFVAGSMRASGFNNPPNRAQLDTSLTDAGVWTHPDLSHDVMEVHYADLMDDFAKYAEQDPRTWLRSVRMQLADLNVQRGGPPEQTFERLEQFLDDAIWSARLGRLAADRFRISTSGVGHAAVQFLKQVQLYLDLERYRRAVDDRFQTHLTDAVESGYKSITLAAHSLGSVVAMRALLLGRCEGHVWASHCVDRLITFGSPIDSLMVLYPELFDPVEEDSGSRKLRWVNYFYGNDPIATDMARARWWLRACAPGVFVVDAPIEVYLGPGSVINAHTEYWFDESMHKDIHGRDKTEEPGHASDRRRSHDSVAPQVGRVFNAIGWAIAAATAWLMIVWWEENLKVVDSMRIVLLSHPVLQGLAWAGCTVSAYSHMKCFSGTVAIRVRWLCVCTLASALLVIAMPALPVVDLVLAVSSDRFAYDGAVHSILTVILLRGWFSPMQLGVTVLVLIPATAAVGVFRAQARRLRTKTVLALLAGTALVLSVCIGTRSNPSNLGAEVGLLSLTFLLWWLGVLVVRLTSVYRAFVGGRQHLDVLSRYWGWLTQPEPWHEPFEVAKKSSEV